MKSPDNFFKFETFQTKLNKINLSAVNNLKRRLNDLDDSDGDLSFFASALEKWNDLNLTHDFRQVRHKIGSSLDVQNLAQIIHKKKILIEVLLEEMQNPESKALNAVLEFLIALSRDLQSEFYEFFPIVFDRLVTLSTRVTDPEIVEDVFICETFLFKYLWKYILRDIENNFEILKKALRSPKEFVVNFTCEAFAFLVRKSKEPEKLFKTLFDSAQKDASLSRGIGRIAVETIKGIDGNMNSKAKNYLAILFKLLTDYDRDESIGDVMNHFIDFCLNQFKTESFAILWDFLLNTSASQMHQINLIHKVVLFKRCKFVADSSRVAIHCATNLSDCDFDVETRRKLFQILEHLLIFKYETFLSDRSVLIEKIFVSQEQFLDQLLEFCANIVQSPVFDSIIKQHLNSLLVRILKNGSKEHIIKLLKFMSFVILKKRPRPVDGRGLGQISKYHLEFETEAPVAIEKLSGLIKKSDDLEMIYYCLILLPNIAPLGETKLLCDIVESHVISKIVPILNSRNSETVDICSKILLESVISLMLLKTPKVPLTEISLDHFVSIIRSNPHSLPTLQALDFYLNHQKSFSVLETFEIMEKLFPILEKNLSWPCRQNRIVVLHIMTLLNLKTNSSIEKLESDCQTVFEICLEAESLPVDLENYRERIRLFRKLDHDFSHLYAPEPFNEICFDMVPVRFLLGTLYENLSVLWKPIIEVLKTFANDLKDKKKINEFLDVLFDHYDQTIMFIKSSEGHDISTDKTVDKIEKILYAKLGDSRPDHLNHRIWLLKGFALFPIVIERKNVVFVESFFKFLMEEFNCYYIYRSSSRENIRKRDADETENVQPKMKNSKITWQTFFAFLEVFEQFKNPKSLHREPELRQLYLDLLSSPNSVAQKHAMNCLFSYNHSYLNKYREQFLNLVDDKSFTSAINSFLIHDNAEDNIIATEDREQITPIFLRILLGKMIASSGTKTHGKSKLEFLRSLIFKVLSSFPEKDQILFIDFIFASIKDFLKHDYTELVYKVPDFVHPEAFIPFKHFQSYISTLESLIKHFGNNHVPVMQYMFKILITCSALCSHLLSVDVRSNLKEYVVNSLKNFRAHCFKVAEYFFTNFISLYPFEALEIDALFESLIKPLAENLHIESLNFPSPLLRLFRVWSENERYFVLLIKHSGEENSTPISAIIRLYSNPKLSNVTYLFINSLFENLLTKNSEPHSKGIVKPITINNFGFSVPKCEDYPQFKNLTFGSIILIPYLKEIIERIKLNHLGQTKLNFSLQEINILARLSMFVTDADDSKTIMILLIHSISQSKRPEVDKEVFILKILAHLSNNLTEDSFFEIVNSTFNLFLMVENPLSRRELCTFFTNLCKVNQKFTKMSTLIADLNAFNPRFPEEPDYDRRISGFKEVANFLDTFDVDQLTNFELTFVQLLLYNCSFFLHTYDDMSLKELSSGTILKVCKLFENSPQLFNDFVVDLILFKIISKGIRHKKHSVSSEFLNTLVELIRSFSNKHIIVDQLLSLGNEDEDLDFWQNIKHIQSHRKARALNRLANNKELLESLYGRVFTNFLIPIVSSFIPSSTESNQTNVALLNAAVESLATFLQYCSWAKYEALISHYVTVLLNEKIDAKIAIRVISGLLEKFTFLKPEDVAAIEKGFQENDFAMILSEYCFESSRGKSRKPGNQLKKKPKKENETESEALIIASENDLLQHKKIYTSLCQKLLPMLHKCLHQKTETDDPDKFEHAEDQEIKTIPIAVAIVKLLKHVRLNQRLFEINLNSIVLRLCEFLQSKAFSIRETARKTLAQILEILGPKHFGHIFSEMKALLVRGYQRHVFIYTTYILLQKLVPQLTGGDLDECMSEVIDVCHLEMFGSLSEEKEVSKIVTKTKEAQKVKAYEMYEILAQFVSERSMLNVIAKLKALLFEVNDHKTKKKIEKAFYHVGRGLVRNQFVSVEALMQFLNEIFFTTTKSQEDKTADEESRKTKSIANERPDSFIIPEKSLRRVNQVSKVNRLSHLHILSNFGLACYLHVLKNHKSLPIEISDEALSSTLPFLEEFLDSNDLKVVTSALGCIVFLLTKFCRQVSFETRSQSIILKIFCLLQKHSGLNQDNAQLITLCFKTIAHFMNVRSECKLTNEQIAILISYAEKDIENNNQNVAIYFLLKSIISRKFVSKEFHLLMEKLMTLAITTDIDQVRDHVVELSIKYLTDYPMDPNRLKGKMVKLTRQLEFEAPTGRMAAITILKTVIRHLPYDVLSPLKNHLFVPISSRLINEDSVECRRIVAETITNLFTKLTSEDLNQFFETFVLPWLGSESILVQTLGSSLCSLFLSHEKDRFADRIPPCLRLISQQLNPERFKSLQEEPTDNENVLKQEDNLLFSHLNFFFKLLKLDNILATVAKTKSNGHFNEIFSHILSSYLVHPHSWIRSLCTKIFGQLFSLFDPDLFASPAVNVQHASIFLFQNAKEKLISLSRKFCLVFRDINNCQMISEQLVKNLVYIARVFIVLDCQEDLNKKQTGNSSSSSLEWLIKKLLYEIKFEVKNQPQCQQKRILFVKWLAAIALKLGPEHISDYLPYILPPLCRESISLQSDGGGGDSSEDELKSLTKQVLLLIRNLVGSETFVDQYNQVRNQISHRRLERRKQRAVQAVTRAAAGIKRKQRKHKNYQAAVKRRRSGNNFTIS